jgi:hypothetical protein
VLDVLDGPVEKNLVGLLSVFSDGRLILLAMEKTEARKQEKGQQAHSYDKKLVMI